MKDIVKARILKIIEKYEKNLCLHCGNLKDPHKRCYKCSAYTYDGEYLLAIKRELT